MQPRSKLSQTVPLATNLNRPERLCACPDGKYDHLLLGTKTVQDIDDTWWRVCDARCRICGGRWYAQFPLEDYIPE